MKKLLILVLIALLLTLSIFIVIQGVHIGSLEILGVKGIQEKSSQLDEKIQQAGKLAEKDYQQALNDVKTNTKKLQEEKNNYEDMTQISEDGDVQAANQIEKYEETLWVKLGNHATTQGVVIKMDVKKGNAQDVYDLQFTATGSYISITDFISAIENDSSLGFKIEEFKLVPSSSGSDLQATFVCKDITIKDVSQSAVTTTTDSNTQTDGTANGTNQNNTNSTDTNSATNTTNGTANNTNTTNSTNATSTNTAR